MGWKSKLGKAAAVLGIAAAAGAIYVEASKPPRPVVTLPVGGRLMLTGVTIVDPASGGLTADASVLIARGRIVRVGRGDLAPGDAAVQVVAAPGKFLSPGFNDMHAHPLGPADPSGDLALMLANGITGFRQMSGSYDLLSERRESRLPIHADAPALLTMPGAVLTPFNAGTVDMATRTVARQAAAGADFVKAGLVGRPVLFAVLAEARRRGLRVDGHVPPSVDVVAAALGGMRAIEHLGPSDGALVACSSARDRLRRELDAIPAMGGPPVELPLVETVAERWLAKLVVNPATRTTPEDTARRRIVVATFDEARCRRVARALRDAGNWQVPTLIRRKASEQADDPAFARDPALRYVGADTLVLWRSTTADYVATVPADARALFRADYALGLRVVRIFAEEGVPMLAGSDASGAGWEVPGFALHREFDELARAGLSPLRILQMTTIDGARFLGRTATMGSVTPGRVADLVLLDGDPTKSLTALHRVAGVVRGGRWYDRAALDALLSRVAANDGRLPR